jgi:hypothetical protein
MTLLDGCTGLRIGELRALQPHHVDTMRCRLHLVDNIPAGLTADDLGRAGAAAVALGARQ